MGGARKALGSRRRLARGVAVALALLAGLGVGVAVAGPGGLDPSFGTSGVTVLERPTDTFPSPTTLAAGGKIVSVTSSLGKVTVSRMLPDGAPDSTFDGDGKAVIESADYLGAFGVALQPDGKIVVVGYANKKETSPGMVWRLKANGGSGAPNGALDPTFNGTGIVELEQRHVQPRRRRCDPAGRQDRRRSERPDTSGPVSGRRLAPAGKRHTGHELRHRRRCRDQRCARR